MNNNNTMNTFEFIDQSYKTYASDKYTNATCYVRINGNHNELLVQRKKDGKPTFWDFPSVSLQEDNEIEKKYLGSYKFCFDHDMQKEILIDFVKANVKRITGGVPDSEPLPF